MKAGDGGERGHCSVNRRPNECQQIDISNACPNNYRFVPVHAREPSLSWDQSKKQCTQFK